MAAKSPQEVRKERIPELAVQTEISGILAGVSSSVRRGRREDEPQAAAISQKMTTRDRDLARQETNILSVQHKSEAQHLSHGARSLPIFDFPLADASITQPNAVSIRGEGWMGTPSLRRSDYSLGGANILLIMSIVAPLSYIFDVESSPLEIDLAVASKTASIDLQSVMPSIEAELDVPTLQIQTAMRSDNVQSESKVEITSLRSAPRLEGKTTDSKITEDIVQTVADASPRRRSANRVVETADIKPLVDQGARFFEAGDVVAARLLFNRAAKAGDPTAALAMGSTYDPATLKKRGVLGVTADLEKARSWYEIAGKLGSPEARVRLKMLD